MSNIGFVSYWGFGRGRAYTTLCVAKMLKEEHNVFVLQQGNNPISKEFVGHAHVDITPSYDIDAEVYRKWIREHKLDAVVLNEYGQWKKETSDLIGIAKEEGCKVYGFFVLEKFDKKQVEGFDRVFVQCVSVERIMRYSKVRNFTYVPYSIDLTEFNRVKPPLEKFTFLHIGGFGGVHNRKNTQAVIDAFVMLNNKDSKLIITAQRDFPIEIPDGHDIEVIRKDLNRDELLDVYHRANVGIYPSKWETIGIPILESLAAGLPVITVDVPPMNEFIKVGMNGYLASCTMSEYDDIAVNVAEVDVLSLKNNMNNIMNSTVYSLLARNARYVITQLYDLEKNKHYILEFLKKDLGEKK